MKRAVSYIRVSTQTQAEEGISLEMQEKKIQSYCELNDLELVETIVDAGISGKNLTGRPGAQKLLEMVRTKKIDAIVVYSLSRLGRSTIDLLETAELLKKHNVSLHSLTESLNTSTALGQFFFTLIASLGEMERLLIGERTKAALQTKRANHEKVSYNAPYGTVYIDGVEVPVAHEQACVEHLRCLRINDPSIGWKKAATLLEKAGYLNRNGVKFGTSSMRVLFKLTNNVVVNNLLDKKKAA